MATATRVEALAQFGNAIDDYPKSVMMKQARVFISELRNRFGTVGLVGMMGATVRQRRVVKTTHKAVIDKMRQDWGSGAVNEALMMVALFNVIARADNREEAYEVIKGVFQTLGPDTMAWLYQSDDLARCEGDAFTNFKTFHTALFDASQSLFPNTQTDEGDIITTTVTRCSNVEVFNALGCPELGKLGCDHDLAGYPAIADRHDFEFRRPCTIAKGGDTCEFRFYRKGTAPDTELIEGVPVHWNESLNR
jgi:hypothetical protein